MYFCESLEPGGTLNLEPWSLNMVPSSELLCCDVELASEALGLFVEPVWNLLCSRGILGQLQM